MDDQKNPNNYSIKEILTDFVMPALDDLRTQQRLQSDNNEKRFQKLETAKNRGIGAFILISAVLVPLSIPVITAVGR